MQWDTPAQYLTDIGPAWSPIPSMALGDTPTPPGGPSPTPPAELPTAALLSRILIEAQRLADGVERCAEALERQAGISRGKDTETKPGVGPLTAHPSSFSMEWAYKGRPLLEKLEKLHDLPHVDWPRNMPPAFGERASDHSLGFVTSALERLAQACAESAGLRVHWGANLFHERNWKAALAARYQHEKDTAPAKLDAGALMILGVGRE